MSYIAIISSSVMPVGDHEARRRVERFINLTRDAADPLSYQSDIYQQIQMKPEGFAQGMNDALQTARRHMVLYAKGVPDFVLCINDDVELSPKAMTELWKHRQDALVTCPTTDVTSCPEQFATGPRWDSPRRLDFVPAICWLIPWPMVWKALSILDGLFDQTLGRAWFEDNLTAALWRKHFDANPFLVAPTSWVKHHGSVTSNLIPEAERTEAGRRYQIRKQELGL